MALTLAQIHTLEILERVSASISVLATTILLSTFWAFKDFRSLSNTLIFFASFANLFASAAALMGRSAIHNPLGGLCQLQAFLLEMFMQSDALWACAMAVNVYLCFFRRFDQVRLRKLHWIYAILCYGIPFIPAMFCLFYQDRRGRMYGDATLWCWIGAKYTEVRIYSYYLTVWIAMAISLTIYFRVGIEIYKVRAQIKAFDDSSNYTLNHTLPSTTTVGRRMSSPVREQPAVIAEPKPTSPFDGSRRIESIPEVEPDVKMSRSNASCTTDRTYPPTSHLSDPGPGDDKLSSLANINGPSIRSSPHRHPISPLKQVHTHASWRASSVSTASTASPDSKLISKPATPTTSHRHPSTQMDKLKWAYTKSALLFTLSILITWVPASANRIQGWTHPNKPNFTLSAMSACLLPLQGFWNTVIFFSSSWGVVTRLWQRWRSRVAADPERGRAAPVTHKVEKKEKGTNQGIDSEEERRSSGRTLVGQEDRERNPDEHRREEEADDDGL